VPKGSRNVWKSDADLQMTQPHTAPNRLGENNEHSLAHIKVSVRIHKLDTLDFITFKLHPKRSRGPRVSMSAQSTLYFHLLNVLMFYAHFGIENRSSSLIYVTQWDVHLGPNVFVCAHS